MDSTTGKDIPLKLYHVSRPTSLPADYDQYRDFVIATYSESEFSS